MNSPSIDTSSVIQRLIERVTDECKRIDVEALYRESLDDCYSFDAVGGPFACMSPSRVLEECDPVAYRCGLSDYSDGQDWVEIEGDYYQRSDVEEVRDEFVAELEKHETEVEQSLEGQDEQDESVAAELEQVRAEIRAVNRHTF